LGIKSRTLAARLKESPRPSRRPSCPIISLSAHGQRNFFPSRGFK